MKSDFRSIGASNLVKRMDGTVSFFYKGDINVDQADQRERDL